MYTAGATVTAGTAVLGMEVAKASKSGASLARTGTTSVWLTVLALVLILVGFAMIAISARRNRPTPS